MCGTFVCYYVLLNTVHKFELTMWINYVTFIPSKSVFMCVLCAIRHCWLSVVEKGDGCPKIEFCIRIMWFILYCSVNMMEFLSILDVVIMDSPGGWQIFVKSVQHCFFDVDSLVVSSWRFLKASLHLPRGLDSVIIYIALFQRTKTCWRCCYDELILKTIP